MGITFIVVEIIYKHYYMMSNSVFQNGVIHTVATWDFKCGVSDLRYALCVKCTVNFEDLVWKKNVKYFYFLFWFHVEIVLCVIY